MKIQKRLSFILIGALAATMLPACGITTTSNTVKLNPDKPVSLTVWHYYNGAQQAAFDTLVSEFNATTGKEKGIYVEGYSQGSVGDLEQAISDAVQGKVGADPLPDIFSTYADTAYSIQQDGKLVDLTKYISDEELSAYVDSYIQEGYFNNDEALYLFPVAKSTEVMMLNVTDWQPFAEETGSTLDELKTIEGVVDVARRYYEWTDEQTPNIPNDGKAFYGRDSMSNYFIIGMKQMDVELFDVENGEVTIQTEKEKIHRLWDNYYVPYVKGYFASMGKFRSDDVKTGDILAYTGSSSSATYFPDMVMTGDTSKEIDFVVLPTPVFEGGKTVNVQQGAGMAVTKSDELHEYAACEFLKWFTQKENNLLFVCESSYLPVTKEANSVEAINETIRKRELTVNDKAYECLVSVLSDFENTTFYCTKCFHNGYSTRKILDYHLSDKASADKAAIDQAVAAGAHREDVIADYVSEESFEQWYHLLCEALNQAAKQ